MWETVKLGTLFKIGSSKRVLKADWRENGIPFYRGREITALSKYGYVDNDLFISETHFAELSSKYGVPQTGDILVTAIGTIGNTYIVKQNDKFYFKDASVLWLSKKSDVNSKFCDYWFKSALFLQQLEVGNGATVDTLSISKLNEMDFVLPPLAEQQRIVAKLDATFAEIDEARDANYLKITEMNTLSNLAFDEWLTKFPIHSEIGKLCDFLNGYAFKSGDAVEQSNVQLLRMGNLYGNQLDLNRKPIFYPNNFADEYQKYVLNCGDIIMTLTGTVGKEDYGYAIEVPKTEKKLLLNQRILKFHNIDTNLIHPQFFLHVLNSQQFLKKLYKTANGTRQANLSSETIKKLEIPLPSIKEQEELLDKFKLLLTNKDIVVSSAKKNVRNCSQLKSAILAKELQSEAA